MRAGVVTTLGMLGFIVVAASRCGGTTDVGSPDSGTSDGSSGHESGTTDSGTTDSGTVDSGGDGGGVACSPACGFGRTCCNGECINPDNDPANCGGCGIKCDGATPYCDGSCKSTPCTVDGGSCAGGAACCGTQCCTAGAICCKGEGPVSGPPECFTPTATEKTCPQGCSPQCVSDRDQKTAIEAVDERKVLEGVAHMPIASWTYKTDRNAVKHIGPMAQDFHSAFGLGDTDRAYDPVDAHGVAFASIKALYEMVESQNARIDRLERENNALRAGVCR